MQHFLDRLASLPFDTSVSLLLDVVVKATLLLLLAAAACALLRRRSAAVRHRVWCLAFCGLLLLPVLTTLLPSWRLPILPQPVDDMALADGESAVPDTELFALEAGTEPIAETNDLIDPFDARIDPLLAGQGIPMPWETSRQPQEAAEIPLPPMIVASTEDALVGSQTAIVPGSVADEPTVSLPWGAVICGLWLLGACLAAWPLLIGFVRNGALHRTARTFDDATRTEWIQTLCTSLGLRRRVRLLETGRAIVPMTWGILRPIVLFPVAWREWTLTRRRLILLHELAHVKRCDVAFQLIARLSCALYWFHPLAWYALRRLRVERELACDDCVLMTGARPSEYAQELLEIARSYQSLALPTTVAMAQTSNLERRIRALLDRARPHLPLSRTAGLLLLIGSALLITGVAVVRPARVAEKEPAVVADEPGQESVSPSEDPDEPASPAPVGEDELTITGTVRGADARPIADAQVVAVRTHMANVSWYVTNEILQTTRTGDEGTFALTVPKSSDRFSDGTYFEHQQIRVFADKDGFSLDEVILDGGLAKQDVELRLAPAIIPLEGRILDLEGRPVQGVRVTVDELSPARSSVDEWIEQANDNPHKAESLFLGERPNEQNRVVRFPAGNEIRINGLPFVEPVETDDEGRFRIDSLGDDHLVKLRIDGPGIASAWVRAVTHEMAPVREPQHYAQYRTGLTYGRTFDYTVEPSQPITGVIRDAETGKPLTGVGVQLQQYGESYWSASRFLSTTTDAQGRYELHGVPKPQADGRGTLLAISPNRDLPYFRRDVRVPKQEGLGPVEFDIALKRAVWVSGQVTNSNTGKPVRALVSYYPFLDNPHVEPYEVFRANTISVGYGNDYATDDEGRFRIPGMPGRGVVRVVAENVPHYHLSAGEDQIDGLRVGERINLYHMRLHGNCNTMVEVNVDVDQTEVECDAAVVPYSTISIDVVDEQDQPLTGVRIAGRLPIKGRGFDGRGMHYWDQWPNHEGHEFTVVPGDGEDLERYLMLHYEESGLGTVARLKDFDLESKAPQRLVLKPCAEITGRLTTGDGQLLTEGYVTAGVGEPGKILPGEGRKHLPFAMPYVQRFEDGDRFKFVVPPNGTYTLLLHGIAGQPDTELATGLDVHPSERIDLGTINIDADPAAWPKPQRTPATTSTTAVSREASPSAAKGAAKPQAAVTVTGTVLLPNGSPAAGAAVRAGVSLWAMLKPIVGEDFELPVIETTTDAAGEFSIDIPTRPYGDLSRLDERWQEIWKETSIAASLPGYGGQWVKYKDIEEGGPITLQLVDDLPVHSRVIDLEGRPVAGVEVQIAGPSRAENEDLSAWITAAKAGELPWTLGNHLAQGVKPGLIGVAGTVTTDEDGRFEIRGMGRERQFNVVFRHDALAYATAGIVTRDIEAFERVITTHGEFGNPTESVYGSRFTFTGEPSRPVVGTIRDAETGEPMPRVGVESYKFTDYPYSNHRVLKTVTDAEGRYRLTGMPKGDGNKIIILPNDEQPYLIQQADVPNPAGLGPATVDVGLHRGLWITGRVTDKITGEPVHSRLHYLPYRTNKYAQAVPEFDENGNSQSDQMRYQTQPDGTYRLVGLPGPAIVGAQSVVKQFRRGVGYEQMTGPKYRNSEVLDTYSNPVSPGPEWPHVMKEVDIAEGVDSFTVDFEMDPGESVWITTLDAIGQPLRGVEVLGIGAGPHSFRTFESHRMQATNFSAREARMILFRKDDLGWAAQIGPQQSSNKGITITLRPVATLKGRLLQDDETPLSGAHIQARPIPSDGGFGVRLPGVTTDVKGRFELTLLPGADYSVNVEGGGVDFAVLTRKLTIGPGESKDLGDLRLAGREFEPVASAEGESVSREATPSAGAQTAKPQAVVGARSDDRMTLRGRVTGPDGGPVEGARVWMAGPPRVSQNWSREPQAVAWLELARSDEQGRFHATVDRDRLEAAGESDQHVEIRLAATAKGLGFGWADCKVTALDDDITVQLVEDIPIEGRILTVDGLPAVGVSVAVSHIPISQAKVDVHVDAIVKSASLSSGVYTNWPAWSGGSPETKPVTTDADGRFRLEGLGAGRVVRLEAHGGGIGAARLSIITHPTPDELRPHGTIAVREGLRESQYFAEFTHIAQPGRTIRGAVTDARTGEPIAGVRVTAMQSWASRKHPSVTGPDGRYEIIGVPKGDESYGYDYSLEFRIDDATHFNRDLRIKEAPGQEPLELDVALARGITLRGRITDAETDRPVTGTVIYNALYPNETVIQMDNASVANPLSSTTVRDDGTYELCVLPGPGAIAASVDGGPYLSATVDPDRLKELVDARGFEMIAQGDFRNLMPAAGGQSRGIMSLSRMQAAALLNPAEGDESLTVDLQVVRGRTLTGTILDDDGRPLTGVRVIGLGPSGTDRSGPLETAEFTVEGLAAGRQRLLMFVHPDRKLGARLVIDGDETTPPTVTLSPTGSVTGRFIDKLGDPLPVVDVSLSIDLGFSSLGTDLWASVDEDGRFRIDGLIADCDYNIRGQIPEQRVSLYVPAKINLRPGETRDLGVFVQKDEWRFVPVDPASGTQSKHLRGRVTGPEGDPVAGAQIWLQRHRGNESEWLPLAESGRGGWWSATSEHTRFDATLTENPDATVRLVATADGVGLGWTDVKVAALEELISLKLVEDVPIEGRILTIDGQPAAGVRVTASELKQPTEPPLDEFIELLRTKAVSSGTYPYPGLWDKELPGQTPAVTDGEGRFRITGMGANRTVSLLLEGEGLHHWSVQVVTRPTPADTERGLIVGAEEGGQDAYYASFEHVAQPGRTLRGVVLDADAGTAIEGAKVGSWSLTNAESTTDADGRFELPGCRKAEVYRIIVRPSDGLHFTKMFTVPDEVGLNPIELSLDVQRGIPAKGRVTVADSDEPVRGEVHYYPLQGNRAAREAGVVPSAPPYASMIENDGSYEIPVFPGPGVIAVKGFGKAYSSATLDIARYKQIVTSKQAHKHAEERGRLVSAWGPGPQIEYYEALALINPDPGTKPLFQDISLTVGLTRSGRILDPEGQPVSDVRISGLTTPSYHFAHRPQETAEFTVTGLRFGESRSLLFYHRERRLGAQLVVTGDEHDPLTVHLQPCGTVSGRIVDRSGTPVPDVTVEFCRAVPTVIVGSGTWTAQTDESGRFKMPSLIGGMEYVLFSSVRGDTHRSLPAESLSIESGQTIELGDLQISDRNR